ncbi:Ornithine decarboxylase [Myotis brandtii]|uniref:Ornithine decarboxylase n=1 Tax=Myotis brandtii TaxID=109478 RepID=S7MWF6_MYOBR|nr:Ornithine decarboxylase [Myotis brandtii]
MGRGVGHDMSILDIGGGFPGVEGSEPEFEEVRQEEERASGGPSLGLLHRVCVCVQGAFETQSYLAEHRPVLSPLPGGTRKLLYYLNEGHYGTFRSFLRDHVPRMPIVVKELCSKPPLFPCILYGPTCDAFDTFYNEEVQLPELDVGDWLIFPSMGAYNSVMSSTFNGFLPATIRYMMGPELRYLRRAQGSDLGPGS